MASASVLNWMLPRAKIEFADKNKEGASAEIDYEDLVERPQGFAKGCCFADGCEPCIVRPA